MIPFIMRAVFSFLIALLISFYVVPLFIAIARRFGVMDIPDGRVKVHKKPTPYLGGLAVYVGFISGLLLTFPFHNDISLFFIGATFLLFLGLIDDLIPLQPYQKLFGQIIAVLCFLKAGLYLKSHLFVYSYANILLSFLWILTIINAFNLIDIMDGLAATTALGCATSFFVLAVLFGNYEVAILIAAFVGSLLSFLWYNKPQARIYLGDAGSLFIGGFLAVIPFLFNWGTYSIYGFLAPMIILAIPLLEVGTLIIVRSWKGIPFYKASPDHFAIYLQKKGWSKERILVYISGLSCVLSCISVAVVWDLVTMSFLATISPVFLVFWYWNLSRNIIKH